MAIIAAGAVVAGLSGLAGPGEGPGDLPGGSSEGGPGGLPGGSTGPEGAAQRFKIVVYRVVGLTNRARLVNLRHTNCLSVEVWQVPTVGGRATHVGSTRPVDRATNPIFEDNIEVLSW